MVIARMRPWAIGLRTNATSCMPGNLMSPTNSPRPRRKRSSSLRGSRAPTPSVAMSGRPSAVAAQQFDVEAHDVAAIGDLADIDRSAGRIGHDAARLGGRRVERKAERTGG